MFDIMFLLSLSFSVEINLSSYSINMLFNENRREGAFLTHCKLSIPCFIITLVKKWCVSAWDIGHELALFGIFVSWTCYLAERL